MPIKEQAPPPAPGIKLEDIYYSVFRYKWLILILSLAGIGAAATIIFLASPLYQSQAKLLIRFVIENRSPSPIADSSAQVKTPDLGGESIINSEIEILTSLDLAQRVVEELRPETILAKVGGGNNPITAASVILQGLQVESQRRSTVIHVSFQHPDSAIVQRVLTSLLTHYVNKHLEIHRGMGILDEYMTRTTDQLRRRLDETEDELRQINVKTNKIIANLADDKNVFFLDIGSKFVAPDGTLSKSVMPDLLHLNAKSYETWAEAIEPMVKKLMGE